MAEKHGTASFAAVPTSGPNSVEVSTSADQPCGCDGTGRIAYVEREPEGTEKPLGHGFYAGPATTHSTVLCKCRTELPEREAKVRWWTSKSVYSAEWLTEGMAGTVFEESAEISVSGEVPVSDANYVLRRTGANFYYPTSIHVELSSDSLRWMFPDDARRLGELLIAAADAAEAYDEVPET